MSTFSPIVQLSGVSRTYTSAAGEVHALKNVDLSIQPGDFVMLTGPSGSGKSTLLHIAALFDFPSRGEVIFCGQEVNGLADKALCHLRKTSIGVVFQGYHLLPHRSVLENILFRFRYFDIRRDRAKRLACEAAEMLGLSNLLDHKALLLSGGEMQRTAIARAIALKPKLLVADEPTGNLDASNTQSVMQHFSDLHREGITMLMVTHDENLLDYCTRHVVCRDGRVSAGISCQDAAIVGNEF